MMDKSKQVYMPVLLTNLISFACVGFSYFVYSKILTPAEFGIYSVALAFNSFGTLFLETGTRNAIIKGNISIEEERSIKSTLTLIIFIFSVVLIVIIAVLKNFVGYINVTIINDFVWVCSFISIFWITSAFIVIPTAYLEKRLEYKKLAWVESLSIILERAAPIFFFNFFDEKLYAFIVLAVVSRLCKSIFLNLYEKGFYRNSKLLFPQAFTVLKESLWIQLGMSSYFVRDNLHILIIGPLFGKDWVGYYAWGLQLCSMSSQIFVQMFSRLSVSISARLDSFEERWELIKLQVVSLSIITTPILFAALLIIPVVNIYFFNNKWDNTLIILPFLFFRMIPGISTTPIASLLMVDKNITYYVKFSWIWTLGELLNCCWMVYCFGVVGLAWSLSISGWFGVWLLCYYNSINFTDIVKTLIFSRVFIASVIIFTLAKYIISISSFIYMPIVLAFILVLIVYSLKKKDILNLIN